MFYNALVDGSQVVTQSGTLRIQIEYGGKELYTSLFELEAGAALASGTLYIVDWLLLLWPTRRRPVARYILAAGVTDTTPHRPVSGPL